MSNNEPDYKDNLFIDSRIRERVFVYCSNKAENYLMVYDSLEEAKKDKDIWKDREVVILGNAVENIYEE